MDLLGMRKMKISLSKNTKLLRVFLITILIAVITIIYFIISSIQNKRPAPAQTPVAPNKIAPYSTSSANLPQSIQEIREKIISSKISENKGDILLYQNEAYKIEYITTPNVFFVTIFKDPAEENKKSAESWFLNFNLVQENLCELPVRFILGKNEIRKTNPSFTSLPNGCL